MPKFGHKALPDIHNGNRSNDHWFPLNSSIHVIHQKSNKYRNTSNHILGIKLSVY